MDLTVKGLQLSEALLQEFGLGSGQSHPHVIALNQFISTAKEPWDKNLYQWRLDRVKNQIDLAGEPGAGMGPPVDSKGNPIPVLPNNEWLKKNPNIVKEVPNEALPPELQKPGMMNKIKGALGIQEDGTVPPMPDITGLQAGQPKDLGDGSKLSMNADGTVSYSGAWGTYIYNAQGQHVKTQSPSFGGYQQTTNAQGQVTDKSYNMGPLSVQQGPQGTSSSYDLGVAKIGQTIDAQGQKTNTVQESTELSRIKSLAKKLLG